MTSKFFFSTLIICLSVFFISICAQFTLPFALIPLTGQTFAIGVVSTVLGGRKSIYTIILYLILGICGVPVFANAQSGLNILQGPTGGYLIGFVVYALLVNNLLNKNKYSYYQAIFANIVAILTTLIIGSIWLKVAKDFLWTQTLEYGFFPFIIPGLIKAVAAAIVGITLAQWLCKTSLKTACS